MRYVLLSLELTIGVSAIGGGYYLLAGAPSLPREWLQGSPLRSYRVPGLVLLVVVAGSMFAAAVTLLWAPLSAGALVSLIAGVVLLGWIVVQVAVIGWRSPLQPTFVVAALLLLILASLVLAYDVRVGPER